jgi:hypothetical protein
MLNRHVKVYVSQVAYAVGLQSGADELVKENIQVSCACASRFGPGA